MPIPDRIDLVPGVSRQDEPGTTGTEVVDRLFDRDDYLDAGKEDAGTAAAAVAAHEAASDPHPGYTTAAELAVGLAGKSDTGHAHPGLYDPAGSASSAQSAAEATAAAALAAHHSPGSTDHDDRYYTEAETDTLLSGKSGTGHTHSYDPSGTAAAAVAAHEAAADPHTGYQRESEKGAANGYASLDGSTKVPAAQLPTVAQGQAGIAPAIAGTPSSTRVLAETGWKDEAAGGSGTTVHWVGGGVPSAGLGANGDLAITWFVGGIPSGRTGPLVVYRKVAGVWGLISTLPTPASTASLSKNSGLTGVGPALAPAYVVENTTVTPSTTVFPDVVGPWTSGAARFFASSAASQAIAIAAPINGVSSLAIAPSGLQVASVRVRTRPTESNATVGVGVFGALSGGSLTAWYGVFASCDSAGVVGLGILAGSGGVPPPMMYNNYLASSAAGVMLAGDMLVLVRNGPIFSCYAVNATTYLPRAGSNLTVVLPSSLADYQYAAGPGVFIDGSTVARLSDFYAVA